MNKFYTDKRDINTWLKMHNIKNYEIVLDQLGQFIVNVEGNIGFFDTKIYCFPVRFGIVSGSFSCEGCQLITLEGCPHTVGANFACGGNNLTSLEFCPQKINGQFAFGQNKITSLKHCPQEHITSFFGPHNQLKSLEYCPDNIYGEFYFDHNKIDNLIHFPKDISGRISLNNNLLGEIENFHDFKTLCEEHIKQKNTFLRDGLDSQLHFKSHMNSKVKL